MSKDQRCCLGMTNCFYLVDKKNFPGGASGKEPFCQCRRPRDVGSVPGSGRSPRKGHGNPLQYSCLKNPMDRGAWQAKGKWCKFFDIKSQFCFFL